jgi:hypothetical protein
LILRNGSIVAELQSAKDGDQIVEAIYTARERRK